MRTPQPNPALPPRFAFNMFQSRVPWLPLSSTLVVLVGLLSQPLPFVFSPGGQNKTLVKDVNSANGPLAAVIALTLERVPPSTLSFRLVIPCSRPFLPHLSPTPLPIAPFPVHCATGPFPFWPLPVRLLPPFVTHSLQKRPLLKPTAPAILFPTAPRYASVSLSSYSSYKAPVSMRFGPCPPERERDSVGNEFQNVPPDPFVR